jgi:Mn-dependent DtxR family transcriptional regulator
LYEEKRGMLSVLRISRILNVHWQTVAKLLEELSREGYVTLIKNKKFPFQITVSLTERGRNFVFELFAIDKGELNPYEKLLLLIIFATGGEIKGTTKLEKLPFLLEHDLNVQLNNIFNYFPYFYGPYSTKIIENVSSLHSKGFIDIEEKVYRLETKGDREVVSRIYTLTLKGEELAKRMFQKLPEELKKRLVELRRYTQKTTKELLDYVYTKYPYFKKYTILDEF